MNKQTQKGFALVLIIILVLIVVGIVVGYYFYLKNGKITLPRRVARLTQRLSNSKLQNVAPSSSPTTGAALDQDLQSIQTGNIDSDFKDIDGDVKSL